MRLEPKQKGHFSVDRPEKKGYGSKSFMGVRLLIPMRPWSTQREEILESDTTDNRSRTFVNKVYKTNQSKYK